MLLSCRPPNAEQLFGALSEMNDICGTAPGYGLLEECLSPVDMAANCRQEMSRPSRAELLRALIALSIRSESSAFMHLFRASAIIA